MCRRFGQTAAGRLQGTIGIKSDKNSGRIEREFTASDR